MDRILVESDCADAASATAATRLAVALVAGARGWPLEEAAARTAANGLCFLQPHVVSGGHGAAWCAAPAASVECLPCDEGGLEGGAAVHVQIEVTGREACEVHVSFL